MTLFLIILALGGPAAAIALEKRLGSWINPVIVCYALGILFALAFTSEATAEVAATISEASIPLAIPLLLFSTDMRALRRVSGKALGGFALAVVSVGVAASIGSQLFVQVEDAPRIAGMLVGVYTGGTPNMVAIGQALEVPHETYLLLNASDVVLGATYLLFLMTAARPIVERLFPAFEGVVEPEVDVEEEPRRRDQVVGTAVGLSVAICILAASAGLTWFAVGELHVAGVILGITTGGLVMSFVPAIRNLSGTYEAGNYLILVFCVAIGAQTDLTALMAASSVVFLFCATVMGIAIVLHMSLCRLFGIDGETAVITSTAAVYGPPFVPIIAKAFGNRALVAPGLAVGILGYAVGNYLGIGLAWFLG